MNELKFDLKHLRKAICTTSFKAFVEEFWNVVSNDVFRGGMVVDVVCEHLQAVKEGKVKRLALSTPIRCGKSLLTEVFYPVWLWIHDPTLRILTVSYGERLAQRDSMRSRALIKSPQFQAMFPHVQIGADQDAKGYYLSTAGGFRLALGTGSNTNGVDCDVCIADDLLEYDKAKSETERENVIDYFTGTLSQRLVLGTGKDRLLLVGHRVHEADVFAHVFNTHGNSGEWSYLVLPMEAQPERTNGYFNGTGWKDPRKEGELLSPERFPRATLEAKKKELRHKYFCLFQSDPVAADGNIFKREWFRYYKHDEEFYYCGGKNLPKKQAWRFATCDIAIGTASHNDYSVMQIWDVVGQDMILVHQLRKKIDGAKLIPIFIQLFQEYKPQLVVVEKETLGQFVLDNLKAANIPVKPFKSQTFGDKETRAVAAEIRLEAGRVWFPSGSSWVPELEKEILNFPNSQFDDQIDSLSQACHIADRYYGKVKEDPTPEEIEEQRRRAEVERQERILNSGSSFRRR